MESITLADAIWAVLGAALVGFVVALVSEHVFKRAEARNDGFIAFCIALIVWILTTIS